MSYKKNMANWSYFCEVKNMFDENFNFSRRNGPPPSFPQPPPPPHFGFQSHFRHPGHPPQPPPFPFDPETFNNLKIFFLLTIILENPDGITAYQLNSKYKFPRTSANRLIAKLIEQGFVFVSTSEVSGRSQTLYKITESGKGYLGRLKEKWAVRFANMAEFAPFDKYADLSICEVIFERALEFLNATESKVDLENYFKEIYGNLDHEIIMIKKRMESLIVAKNELDIVIRVISKQESLNKEEITKLLEKTKEDQKDSRRLTEENVR